MLKRSAVISTALLASVALVGGATAAQKTTSVRELAAGPLVAKLPGHPAYRFVILAAPFRGHAVVAVELMRARGSAQQTTVYRFSLPQRSLRIGGKLVNATLDTGSGLGRFGRIRLSFSCRKPAAGSACAGSRRNRSGTVTGTVDFRTGLGRIRAGSLPAKIVAKRVALASSGADAGAGIGPPPIPKPNCRQYPHAVVLALIPAANGASRDSGVTTFLAAGQRTGPLAILAAATRQRPPATEIVGVQATAPRSALTLTGIRAARFTAAEIPFITGRLSFSRTGPLQGCTRRAATGRATGSLGLQTDAFGRVPLAASAAGAILIGPA